MTRYPRVEGSRATSPWRSMTRRPTPRAARGLHRGARLLDPLWEGLLDLDPDFFEAYLRLLVGAVAQRTARAQGRRSSCCWRWTPPRRTCSSPGIRRARRRRDRPRGRRAEELMEVLELTSTLGIHAATSACRSSWRARGRPAADRLRARRAPPRGQGRLRGQARLLASRSGTTSSRWTPSSSAAYTGFSGAVDARRARAEGQGDDLHRVRRRRDSTLLSRLRARIRNTLGSGHHCKRNPNSTNCSGQIVVDGHCTTPPPPPRSAAPAWAPSSR